MHDVTAYIDPGTGSLLLQAVAGGVAASGVLARLYWARIVRVLRIRKAADR